MDHSSALSPDAIGSGQACDPSAVRHYSRPAEMWHTVAVAVKLMVSGAEQEGHLQAPTAAAVNSPMQPRQKACPHSADTGSCRCRTHDEECTAPA